LPLASNLPQLINSTYKAKPMANETARYLRKTMTPQEVKLWVHLRSWRARGYHFRRQAPKGRAIVDFACLKHRIIVEVDGGQHNADENARRDSERDARLNKTGFRVLRFWNNEVEGNLAGVLEAIDTVLKEPPPPGGPSDATLPRRGRDKHATPPTSAPPRRVDRDPCT
jgi:very-short-patch-repair endonuclease